MRLVIAMLLAAASAKAQGPAGLGSWIAVEQTGKDREAPNFAADRAMAESRSGYTATVLQDGRILLAGGGTRSLEIFDPKKKEWTPVAGQLSAARSRHAAALLQVGKVLIAGGRDCDVPLNSTDLYDPATGSVTPSGFLAVPRAGHTATTLLDGKVLIAGGDGLASAEIYDPERQSFSPTGSMSGARAGHAAILLPDNNNVLLAGGRDAEGAALASAEIYLPAEGVFGPAAPMAQTAAEPVFRRAKRGTVIASAEAFAFPTVRAAWNDQKDGGLTVDGKGWQPGESVRLSFQGHELAAAADAGGSFSQIFAGDGMAETPASELSARSLRWHTIIHLMFSTSITINSQTCGNTYPYASSYAITVNGGYILKPAGIVALLSSTNNFVNAYEVAETDLSDGTATLSASLTPGSYSLEIEYFGDTNYYSSISTGNLICTVQIGSVTDAISSSANPSVYGQPVNIVDQLQYPSLGVAPTGTVSCASLADLGTAPVQNGKAVLPEPLLPLGQSVVHCVYNGDSNWEDGQVYSMNWPTLYQLVTQASSSATISATPSPAVYGQDVTLQYQIAPVAPSQAAIQGTCTVTAENTVSGDCGLVPVSASLTLTNLAAGIHSFAVTYAGNANIKGSSQTANLTVNKATPSVSVSSSANPAPAGQSVTFTATVSGPTPTGSVTFSDGNTTLGTRGLGANGTAAFATSSLTAGSHTITAAYSGDGNFNTSSGSLVQSVGSQCDLNGDGSITIADARRAISEVLGIQDGKANIVDVQIEINAVLKLGCS
jgi:hypothetical protein